MKKVAVFTGTRADYGLLYWILKGLQQSPQAELQLLVGGMHLSSKFGLTVSQIEEDGFTITERLDFLQDGDSPLSISQSVGYATIAAAEAFSTLSPDVLVVLGDRFEALGVAQAAMIAQIPIVHIHGGELTEGLIDDSIRHSLTKMAYLHFSATDEYCRRIIQLGESPERVFNFGAPGIDNIKKLPLLDKTALSHSLQIANLSDFFLVTYHPVTLATDGAITALDNLLLVLDEFKYFQVVITFPNADTFGRAILDKLVLYQERQPDRVFLYDSIGQVRYLSAMKHANLVIGNSSSGIIEAPSFKVPTINIGDRQKGRQAAKSVIHCIDDISEIRNAISTALSNEFRASFCDGANPYGDGNSSDKIVKTLLSYKFNGTQKSFYDIK